MGIGIAEKVASYLEDLTSTSAVVTTLGASLVYGTNLFIILEPDVNATNIITIIPYSGESPDPRDSYKYRSSFQIRTKLRSRLKSLNLQQDFITLLHNNTTACTQCKITANQSSPIILGLDEGGKSMIMVTNYSSRHVRF